MLEDAIRATKEQITLNEADTSALNQSANSAHFDQSQFEMNLRDEVKKLEEKIDAVKNISCSLIEDVSENQKQELQTVQDRFSKVKNILRCYATNCMCQFFVL